MAYLAVVGSKAVNGVAAIHSEIIKEDIFPQVHRPARPAMRFPSRQSCDVLGERQPRASVGCLVLRLA
jgi:hypothetical protein